MPSRDAYLIHCNRFMQRRNKIELRKITKRMKRKKKRGLKKEAGRQPQIMTELIHPPKIQLLKTTVLQQMKSLKESK